ncbi:MAG: sigma-54-dependent Fis family transcriptional regulator [Candidatus Schekmanbacteria bacterium]|nr:MAG: sigma-54-dependent Fis family transcriptional regulator [Candidatus Schekmanbacteria bacterium]
MPRIMVVDDEKNLLEFMEIMLEQEGFNVTTCQNGEKALKILKEELFDIVITDIKMPRISGIDILKYIKNTSPDTDVIMITAYASHETAVEAMKAGAYDYISKPFNNEQIKLVIRKALEKHTLKKENVRLRRRFEREESSRNKIIGNSKEIKNVLELIKKVSKTNSTVLIYGESGTGKELVARAIHENSQRANQPFESINCGALTETLLESELFGHEKGAFTDAIRTQQGLFEIADGGTLFLDEIGETSQSTQVKLLRVLQEMEIKRVGGNKRIKVDVRIVSATNKDLKKLVQEGKFREDLFYRVNVFPITVPPLRKRLDDIPDLVEYFIKKCSKENGRKAPNLHPDTLSLMKQYSWPGNIRELENVIERLLILCPDNEITPNYLPEEIKNPNLSKNIYEVSELQLPEINPQGINLEEIMMNIEKRYLLKALENTGGKKTKAAELLNLSFRSFRYLLNKYNIN